MKYKRILLKLSGESLMGDQSYGISPAMLEQYGADIKAVAAKGCQVAIVIGGGTGNPFFTTDTASTLRAVEIEADVILKGTRVDGVYTADPEKDPTATKYHHLSYSEALEKKLKIMDLTAFALAEDNKLPIYVFDMNRPGNLLRVVEGEEIGTLVAS